MPWLLALAFFFLCCALVFTHLIPARVAYDQLLYHEPTIRFFAEQLPRPDFTDYFSATTPGYHLLLACVARLGADSTLALQLASALIGALLIARVATLTSRAHGPDPLAGALLAIPLCCSMYTIHSAAWLLPDNLGWLGVVTMLGICLRRRFTLREACACGAVLIGLVLVRQLHLWTAGVAVAAAWMSARESDSPNASSALFSNTAGRLGGALFAALCALPAVLALAWFHGIWGGLVPYRFQFQYPGSLNPAAPAFLLALFGVAGLFFAPWWAPMLMHAWRTTRSWLVFALLLGLAAGTLAPTTYNADAGRWTGLWQAAAKAPVVGHVSLVLAPASVFGALVVFLLLLRLDVRRRVVCLAAIAGFCAAYAAGGELWQRYAEPFVLFMLAILAALGSSRERSAAADPGRLALAGPAALSVLLALVTVQGTRHWRPIADGPPPIRAEDDTSPRPVPLEISVPRR